MTDRYEVLRAFAYSPDPAVRDRQRRGDGVPFEDREVTVVRPREDGQPMYVEGLPDDVAQPLLAAGAIGSLSSGAVDTLDATPAARALAAELGLDLATVTGTGQDGRISVNDVRAALLEAQVDGEVTDDEDPDWDDEEDDDADE
ncbi:MAG TPA: hypothetical protein DCK83_08685 [Gallionellaceae bacterium]|nr:hypothetical protein [Gallionellaceae bacterium]